MRSFCLTKYVVGSALSAVHPYTFISMFTTKFYIVILWILHTGLVYSLMRLYNNLCTLLFTRQLTTNAVACSVYFGVALATANSINIVIQLDRLNAKLKLCIFLSTSVFG